MSEEFKNTPRKDATLLPVPEGLSRCPIYRYEEPSTPLRVQCICDGILCRTCNKNRIHRPISNRWDERGGFGHMPYFTAMIPCKDCRAKKNAEEDEERQARKTQPAKAK